MQDAAPAAPVRFPAKWLTLLASLGVAETGYLLWVRAQHVLRLRVAAAFTDACCCRTSSSAAPWPVQSPAAATLC